MDKHIIKEMVKIDTKEVINILPEKIRQELYKVKNVDKLQEIRLRVNRPLIFQIGEKEEITSYYTSAEDVKGLMQKISNYSIYAFQEQLKQGYITLKGGHRVGICGSFVLENNTIKTIKDVGSANIRISNEIIDCSKKVMPYVMNKNDVQNTIIISPPRCGKTTIIRDIARNLSYRGKKVCVIDERSEIAGCYLGVPQMTLGIRTDVLDNCPKSEGINMAIRTMSPQVIICDEIGTVKDVESILMALNSGVCIIATLHGYSIEDYFHRAVFKELVENKVFNVGIVLSANNGAGTIEYVYDIINKKKVESRL